MKKAKRQHFSFRIPSELLHELRAAAKRRGVTITSICEDAFVDKCRELALSLNN